MSSTEFTAIRYRLKTALYIIVAVLYALSHYAAFKPVVLAPSSAVLFDAFLQAALFTVLGFLLWNIIYFGSFSSISTLQQMVNYSAMGILFIAIGIGIEYLACWVVLGKEKVVAFLPVLPAKILMSVLVYLVLVFHFHLSSLRKKSITDESIETESELENIPDETPVSTVPEKEILERIALKQGTKIHVILVPEIIYIRAEGDYAEIVTENGKFLKEQTMKYFEMHLPPKKFVRIHRSYIVNVEEISRIELYENKGQQITLKNGEKLKASITGYKALKTALML